MVSLSWSLSLSYFTNEVKSLMRFNDNYNSFILRMLMILKYCFVFYFLSGFDFEL